MQEAESVRVGARMNEGRGGSSACGREEVKAVKLRVRLSIARAKRRPGAVGKPLAGRRARRVGAARNVYDAALVLSKQIQPLRLVVTADLLCCCSHCRLAVCNSKGLSRRKGCSVLSA